MLIHFTPYLTRWGLKDRPYEVKHVDRILKEGFLPNSNFGIAHNDIEINECRSQFIHHGVRANRKTVHGNFCLPAVILVDDKDLPVFQGYDGSLHRVCSVHIPPDRILKQIVFQPAALFDLFISANAKAFKHIAHEAAKYEYNEYFLSLTRIANGGKDEISNL